MKWPFLRAAAKTAERPKMRAGSKIFIIGTQKSGTSWLRDCLEEFVPFCKPEWYYPDVIDGIARHINTFGGSLLEDKRNAMIQALCAATWDILNGEFPGEKSAYPCSNAFGELRPDVHPFAVQLTRKYFPDARTVVIVRDPRAVFNSLRHYLEHFKEGWSKELDPEIFAKNWSEQNLQWVRDKPDAVVLYEKLKNDFRTTMDNTLGGLRIKHSADDILKAEAAVYSVEKLRPRQPEIYRTGTTNEWKAKVEPNVARVIFDVAGPAMSEIGYDLSAMG